MKVSHLWFRDSPGRALCSEYFGCSIPGGSQRSQPAECLHASHPGASAGQKPLPGPSCPQEPPCWRRLERAEHPFWHWSEETSQSKPLQCSLLCPVSIWQHRSHCDREGSHSSLVSTFLQESNHLLLANHRKERFIGISDQVPVGCWEILRLCFCGL